MHCSRRSHKRQAVAGKWILGIDPAKERQTAILIDPSGETQGSSFSFKVTSQGFRETLPKQLERRLPAAIPDHRRRRDILQTSGRPSPLSAWPGIHGCPGQSVDDASFASVAGSRLFAYRSQGRPADRRKCPEEARLPALRQGDVPAGYSGHDPKVSNGCWDQDGNRVPHVPRDRNNHLSRQRRHAREGSVYGEPCFVPDHRTVRSPAGRGVA